MSSPDRTTRHGRDRRWPDSSGLLLLLGGMALVGLAATGTGVEAVQAIFAASGPVVFVLGCFAHRIEGDVEMSADGLKAFVLAVDQRVADGVIPPEEANEVLVEAVEQLPARGSGTPAEQAETAVDRALSRLRFEVDLMDSVARRYEQAGTQVRRDALLRSGGRALRPDLLIDHDDRLEVVELKATRPRPEHVQQVAEYAAAARESEQRAVEGILATPAESGLPPASTRELAEALNVRLMLIDADGNLVSADGHD